MRRKSESPLKKGGRRRNRAEGLSEENGVAILQHPHTTFRASANVIFHAVVLAQHLDMCEEHESRHGVAPASDASAVERGSNVGSVIKGGKDVAACGPAKHITTINGVRILHGG